MQDSIFTQLIKTKSPEDFIYQDDTCVVFLTIDPITPGHMLVIPREQVDHLWDLDDETYHHLWTVAKQMAGVLRRAYGDEYRRIGSVVEGFGVPHAHIHVFGYREDLEHTIKAHADNRPGTTPVEINKITTKLRASL